MLMKKIYLAGVFAFLLPLGSIAQEAAGPYLAARAALRANDFRPAANYFLVALRSEPNNLGFARGALISYLAQGRVDDAAPFAEYLLANNADGLEPNVVHLSALWAKGDLDGVATLLGSGSVVEPSVDALIAGWLRAAEGDFDGAIALFDEVLEDGGLTGFALYHKAIALRMSGQNADAIALFEGEHGDALLGSRQGVILLAALLHQSGRADDALALLNTHLPQGSYAVADTYRAAILGQRSYTPAIPTTPAEGVGELLFTLAAALPSEDRELALLSYTRAAEYLFPGNSDITLLSADFLRRLDSLAIAADTFAGIPRESAQHLAGQLGYISVLGQSNRDAEALVQLRSLAMTFPDNIDVLMAYGNAQRRAEDFEAAESTYSNVIELLGDPQPPHWFTWFVRGVAFHRQEEWPAAEADFRQALALAPDRAVVLNYLGYSLVERNEKLDEALAMIQRAATVEPDAGHIIDSLGWVYYRMGRYADALEAMERATNLLPTNAEVNDHLGDVYWVLGRRAEARFQWRRSLSFDPDTEREIRIRAKLERGLDAILAEEGDQ